MGAGISSLIKQLDSIQSAILLPTMSTLEKLLNHGELHPDTITTPLTWLYS